MVPAPVALCKITIHHSVSPSLLVVRENLIHFCVQHLAEDLLHRARHMGVAQTWLKNNPRVSWAEGKTCFHGDMQQHYIHKNYEPVAGTLVKWGRVRWDAVENRQGQITKALYHEKYFNFIFKAMGRQKEFWSREYSTHISISITMLWKAWRTLIGRKRD